MLLLTGNGTTLGSLMTASIYCKIKINHVSHQEQFLRGPCWSPPVTAVERQRSQTARPAPGLESCSDLDLVYSTLTQGVWSFHTPIPFGKNTDHGKIPWSLYGLH